EQCNPRSENLEKMSARELAEVFVEEEKFVQEALRAAVGELTKAIEVVAEALRHGGRLFYVGAGSSGRIGVLDASEIPPTFGAPPDLVQGVIAGAWRRFIAARKVPKTRKVPAHWLWMSAK